MESPFLFILTIYPGSPFVSTGDEEAAIWKAPEIFYEVSVYRYPRQEKHFAASGIVV